MSLAFSTFSNLEVIPKEDVYNWLITYITTEELEEHEKEEALEKEEEIE